MLPEDRVQLVVFGIGHERFAVAMSMLDEVVELPALQRMPDAPPSVVGVASMRRTRVTVYDPGVVLNVVGTLDGVALLLTHGGRAVALAVDDVFDAITVARGDVRSAPGKGSDGILIGVIHRGDDLIAVLDGNALVDAVTVVSAGAPV